MVRRPWTRPALRPLVLVAAMACAPLSALAVEASISTAPNPGVPPPQTISKVAQDAPVYWAGWAKNYGLKLDTPASSSSYVDTKGFVPYADPVNHLLFEFDLYNSPSKCPSGGAASDPCTKAAASLAAYDSDTYQLVATDGPDEPLARISEPPGANSKDPGLVIDSADRVLVYPIADTTVGVLSETTLRPLGSFNPYQPPPAVPVMSIAGMSVYAPADELLVLTTYGNAYQALPPTRPGVFLTAYGMHDVLAAVAHNGTPSVRWSVQVPGCQNGLGAFFASAAAYRGTATATTPPQVYVPCFLNGSIPNQSTNGVNDVGVVSLGLGNQNGTCPDLCPDGTSTVALAPGPARDFLFDPTSSRGFMPFQDTQNGTQVLVYDGHQDQFIGRTHVADTPDTNRGAFGIDTTTGRLYAVFPSYGLIVVDGRRTPVSPGVRYSQFAGDEDYDSIPVFPPSSAHPYTRIMMPFELGDVPGCSGPCYVPTLPVFADTLSVTVDPPASNVDNGNTLRTPAPAGAQIARLYGATARGYGYHTDLVGGTDGVVADLIGQPAGFTLPLGHGDRDLLGGYVKKVNVRTASVDGVASALGDGNGGTSYGFQQCTDPTHVANCEPPPPCPATTVVACPTAPQPSATPPQTSQSWPYPDAACSQPDATAKPTDTKSGAYSNAPGASSPVPAPGSDASAVASVDCKPGEVGGSALLQGSGTTASGVPDLSISYASSTSSITVAPDGTSISTTVTSEARGVTVAGLVSYGDIKQIATTTASGRPGTATITRTVTMSDVKMVTDTATGATTVLCVAVCSSSESAVDQINQRFPAVLAVMLPAPDERYANQCSTSGNTTTCHGSPGGYLAAVQANLTQQAGDTQFNGMSAAEASLLPALRVVTYSPKSGNPVISRQVTDFAGVDTDSEYGIEVLPAPEASDFTGPILDGAPAAAGVPGTSRFVPGLPGTSGGGSAQPTAADGAGATGPAAATGTLEQQVLSGVSWLRRSPMQALQMLAFLGMLGMPLVLSRRRWTWSFDHDEE